MHGADREPDRMVEQRGPSTKSEADLPSSLVLLEAILMNGSEEADIVGTESGEREG